MEPIVKSIFSVDDIIVDICKRDSDFTNFSENLKDVLKK